MLANGGRYDGVVTSFRNVIDTHPDLIQHRGDNQGNTCHVTGGAIYVNELYKFHETFQVGVAPNEV